MRTWALALLGFVAAATATQLDCICTREYMPLCGSDGVTYPNRCVFRCAAKSNSDLKVVAEGECTHKFDVPCICTLDYRPVCGSDGVTYPNLCDFNCHARQNDDLKIVANGECQATMLQRSAAPICACTREFNPVCGSDGHTYANPCLLKCQKKVDNSLSAAHFGECEDKVERPVCACSREYYPLCGSDGITYNNLCLLKCQQKVQNSLAVSHVGRCEEVQLASRKVCPCPLIFRPVCGTDGVTYDNECALNCKAKNGNGELKVFHQGACIMPFAKAGGICACNKIYLPVCGTDGVTYNNPCLIGCQQRENADLTIAHYGVCTNDLTDLKVSRACMCPKIMKPVCGTDGRTYNNECLLNCQKATQNADLKVFHQGWCAVPISAALAPCMCPKDLRPVCGTDGVTYSNECMLNCAKATKNADLKVFHQGVCAVPVSADMSACICTREYMPVCGTDGKTYGNECMLNCAKATKNADLKLAYKGECVAAASARLAPCMCPRDYRPVCGTDGVTYGNECMLNCAKATKNADLKVFHQGMCIVPVAQADDVCICNRMYLPVCGSNGVTYDNPCLLGCDQKSNANLAISYYGACSEQPTLPKGVACPCPFIYAPVCGTDGVTYDNECILNCKAKNVNHNLKVFHHGFCAVPVRSAAEDFCVCTDDYRPVCGSNQKTYANKCEFECDHKKQNGLTITHEGECKKPRICACPRIYAPVCGSDGQTYDNSCIFECAKQDQPGLTVQHESEC